ncbi:MAG: hypothetical protein A3J49_03320 [Gallionellales bacterium RIFCSPHIGHO2_02_FULL_57_16]|nr:MAG: hypothetical protein A3J49_03320 [Gallionellales bacterium RIFCSPHIGHO2_02_FULL_57_16]
MKSGIVGFASPKTNEAAVSSLRAKLPLVEKRTATEINSSLAIDRDIENAVLSWRGKDANALFKTPAGTDFTWEELDLAGIIHEYSTLSKLPFRTALENTFEWLKRHPKAMERYTNGDANFAESPDGVSGFALPSGWKADPQAMDTFRRARVFQAGNPACDLAHAVIEVGNGDAWVRSRIATLTAENARMRAESAKRATATR